TRHDDPNVELVYPCGAWFQPPPGRYRVWIQGDWQMSPYSLVLGYSGTPFRGRGVTTAIPVIEAGRVALPSRLAVAPHLTLRLLHAGSYLEGEFPRWEISRRRPSHQVRKGLLMPAGPTISGLWDERAQRYVALSRLFEVRARQTVEAPLERPSGVAHVVVQVQRHALAKTVADSAVELLLQRRGRYIRPDVTVTMADMVYGLWYGQAPGPVELRGQSSQSFLEPKKLELFPGRIERLAERLRPLPTFAAGLEN
ncbi:MAG: hypothetical protein ACRDHY_18305, partial [Anaerolineales bacterium]